MIYSFVFFKITDNVSLWKSFRYATNKYTENLF